MDIDGILHSIDKKIIIFLIFITNIEAMSVFLELDINPVQTEYPIPLCDKFVIQSFWWAIHVCKFL